MGNKRRGSIFLLALGALVILFILGIALTFFTGSEDWASGLSFESEVAFNLAESATEEFVARLKNALNNDDPGNMLFKVLRGKKVNPDEEIPLDAPQVAALTGFTRKTAHDVYGFRFGSGMANSKDFEVSAVIKLREVNPVKPKDGSFAIFDKKEKQGELRVTSVVNYRGRYAKITLVFLLRVVKTFIPPYNFFTLFIKDGSAFGGSDFNSFESLTGKQDTYVTLDHGWNDVINNFDATKNVQDWEKALTQHQVPPGRVYMGQDPQLGVPATMIQATNGAKMLVDRPTLDQGKALQYNGQDNFWLKFDVPWMLFDDYRKKVTEVQGDKAIKKDMWDGIKGLFTDVFGKDVEIRVINVGAGQELTQDVAFGEPAFVRAVQSYIKFRDHRLRAPGQIPMEVKQVLYPEITRSGLHVFGHAPPTGGINPYSGADFSKLSPTIVYGKVMRQYNRVVSLRRKPGTGNPFVDPKDPGTPINLEIPFIGTEPAPDGSAPPISVSFSKKSPLTATEAFMLFSGFSVQPTYVDILKHNWPDLPPGYREIQYIEKMMSNAGQEPINWGLANFVQRLGISGGVIPTTRYSGGLKDIISFENVGGFMANHQYPGMPGDLSTYVQNSPVRAFYEGDLWFAMPDPSQAYLMDFYFIPRSTEDFFRGRTTISIGGNYYDRFQIKYVNNGTLELSGILALNDPADLVLNNLNFRGRGVIYASPMMGGGPVSIQGNFYPAHAADVAHAMERTVRADPSPDMVTIIAPMIEINTDAASTAKCYVEANLISVQEPIRIKGKKELVIRGTVACPYLNMKNCIQAPTTIKYNSLNAAWGIKPEWYDQMYVAKIVTGGVGKFDWTYVQRQ